MSEIGRSLVFIGTVLVVLGVVVILIGKVPGIGKLPGDILIERKNFTFYFPIVTCIVISILFSLVSWLIGKR